MPCSSASGCSYLSPAPCVCTSPYLPPNTLPVLTDWETLLTLKLGEHPSPASWVCRLAEHGGVVWDSKYLVVPISSLFFSPLLSTFSIPKPGGWVHWEECQGCAGRPCWKRGTSSPPCTAWEGHSDPVPLSTVTLSPYPQWVEGSGCHQGH